MLNKLIDVHKQIDKFNKNKNLMDKVKNILDIDNSIIENSKLQNKLLNEIINNSKYILPILNVLNDRNQLSLLLDKNLNITNIESLLIIYIYLYQQNDLKIEYKENQLDLNNKINIKKQYENIQDKYLCKNNEEDNNDIEQVKNIQKYIYQIPVNKIFEKYDLNDFKKIIINKLDNNNQINNYAFDFLFVFCLMNNIDFNKYNYLLIDKIKDLNFEIRFFDYTINTLQGSTSIVFNLKKIINNLNDNLILLQYITKRELTSSSMKELEWNQDYIFTLFDFNNINLFDLNEDIKHNQISNLFKTINFKISTNENIKDIDFEKVYMKEEYKMIINLDIDDEVDINNYKIDIFKNNVLTLTEKFKLIEKLLYQNSFEYININNSKKYLLYFILKNINSIDEILNYENITRYLYQIFINQYLEYDEVRLNHFGNMENRNFDLIILLEKFINKEFILNLNLKLSDNNKLKIKEYSKKDINNIIKIYLNTKIIDNLNFEKPEDFKLNQLINLYNIEKLIELSKFKNNSYFYEITKDYDYLFSNNKFLNLLFNYLIKENRKADIKYYINNYFSIIKKNKNLDNYLLKNSNDFNMINNNYIFKLFYQNNKISIDEYKSKLLNYINYLYNDNNLNEIENILSNEFNIKNINEFINTIDNLDLQFIFKINLLNKNNNNYQKDILNFIDFFNKNKFDILLNKKNIENLVKNTYSFNNQKSLFEIMIKEFPQNIGLVSDILKLAKHLNIEIDEFYLDKFYFLLIDENSKNEF